MGGGVDDGRMLDRWRGGGWFDRERGGGWRIKGGHTIRLKRTRWEVLTQSMWRAFTRNRPYK